jgi:hypothetical protein
MCRARQATLTFPLAPLSLRHAAVAYAADGRRLRC